jgi:SAM-dependent methyltransferase
MTVEALFRLYAETPRQGPGSRASTLAALARLAPLPANARVLDIGCGTGAQWLVLAGALGATVVTLDIQRPFLTRLAANASGQAVFPVQASMLAMPFPPSSFDLVWSEGAAYIAGIANSLRMWRELLRPGGQAAFTELCWVGSERPPEAARYFEAVYPAMLHVAGNRLLIEQAGFNLAADFVLPRRDWEEEYYAPLGARMAQLRGEAAADPALAAVLAETEEEIEMFSRFGSSYGYAFFVIRKRA